MKKMKLFWILLAAGLLTAAGLSGCQLFREEKSDTPSAPALSPEQITGVFYQQSHMMRTECFSFSLSEQDGSVLLDAWCFDGEENEIELSGREVPAEKFEELRRLFEEQNVCDFLQTHSNSSAPEEIPDQTVWTFRVTQKDGTAISADTAGTFGETLETFFRELAAASE